MVSIIAFGLWFQTAQIMAAFSPAIALQAPIPVHGRIQIQVTASDATPDPDDYEANVIWIEWYLDGTVRDRQSVPPITTATATFPLDTRTVSEGQHAIMAKASDVNGNIGMATVSIDVRNVPTDTTPPNVTISIVSTAELFVDGVKVAESDIAGPIKYTIPRQQPPRAYQLEVQMR